MALTPGQQKCIETLDRSLVVAAGAGSGKTFTLTKRIVSAIESGAVDGIERVCAITFTNKAAGELKSRIKAELRASGLAEQALAVDEAWVSTIHGMCARILRAHALELDMDPAFKMIDAADAAVLQGRAIDGVLRSAQAGSADFVRAAGVDPQALDALFDEYPARSSSFSASSVEAMLRVIMGAAGASVRGFDALVVQDSQANPAALVDIVVQTFDALVDATAAQNPTEARAEWMARAQEQLDAIRVGMAEHARDARWAVRALDGLPLPKRVGTAAFKEQASEAIGIYQACVMELRLAAAAPHLKTLVALARVAADAFARAKRAAGVLDNDDLLVEAYRAVTEHPDIAALYADKFQLVMIDEFQDTDQMQVDMVKLLAGPDARRLCTVGDAQQSIYRFRGADVAVYRKHLEEVRARNAADVILLPDNFRSHADVLALVDRVFERSEMFGGEFMSLAPGRDEARVKRPFTAGLPRVHVQLTSNSFRGASTAYVRQVAAVRVAGALAELRDAGHAAGEMAVLLGSMTYAGIYADALRARGLACVIAGGSVFAGTPEARMVGDLTQVAANPGQTQALHNVLTGPLFCLSASDLLELSTYTGEDGEYRRGRLDRGIHSAVRKLREDGAPASWSPRLELAVRVMGDFLAAVGKSKVSRALMRVFVDSGWLARMQEAGPEGLACAANAYKACRMVADIEAASAAGPAKVAQGYAAMLDYAKEAPGALSATGGDFVRIMTVHASKGLEFPIVAVAEFRDVSGPSARLLACEAAGRTYLSLDLGNTVSALEGAARLKTLPDLYASLTEGMVDEDDFLRAIEQADGPLARRAALFGRELLGDSEEAKRLLYVALTRAKEALVVSLTGKRTKDNPNARPKNCLGALPDALAGEEGFAPGMSQLDYRGSAPAMVEHVALEADDELAAAGGAGTPRVAANLPFAIPAPEPRPRISRVPYAPAHEGVFSYSSVAESAHGGDLLERLARAFFVSADAPSGDEGEDGGRAGLEPSAIDGASANRVPTAPIDGHPGATGANPAAGTSVAEGNDDGFSSDGLYGTWAAARNAAVVDEDDGSWAYVGAPTADSDKATDLGTAFHRLAQYAVNTRGLHAQLGTPTLRKPDKSRIDALTRTCRLDDAARARLDAALDCWFASDVARAVEAFPNLRAEAPFFLEVPAADEDQGRNTFLEGEIDLLALDAEGARATVVDYKTGGFDDETAEALARKHVLQAACYAYAVMAQGATQVDVVFVRVERPRPLAPDQPQCVRYRFAASDRPTLLEALRSVPG